VLAEEAEDVIVALVGELLAELLDVLQEALDRCVKRETFLLLDPGDLKALSLLSFEGLSGGVAGGGAEPLAVLTPLKHTPGDRGSARSGSTKS
jgi:hypothetical protein